MSTLCQGTNGASLWMYPNNCFRPGGVDQYSGAPTTDIGEPLLIKLKILPRGVWFDWFVDRVTVKNISTDITYIFPCYSWIQDETLIFEGRGNISQHFCHYLFLSCLARLVWFSTVWSGLPLCALSCITWSCWNTCLILCCQLVETCSLVSVLLLWHIFHSYY